MKNTSKPIIIIMCILLMMPLSTGMVFASNSSNENDTNSVLLVDEEVVTIPESATIHQMVSTPPDFSITRGTSRPSATYDYLLNGPYYFSAISAPANQSYYTNYLLYGKTTYKIQVTNNGSDYVHVIACTTTIPTFGAMTVAPYQTYTMQFSVGSASTLVYAQAICYSATMNITGCIYS